MGITYNIFKLKASRIRKQKIALFAKKPLCKIKVKVNATKEFNFKSGYTFYFYNDNFILNAMPPLIFSIVSNVSQTLQNIKNPVHTRPTATQLEWLWQGLKTNQEFAFTQLRCVQVMYVNIVKYR